MAETLGIPRPKNLENIQVRPKGHSGLTRGKWEQSQIFQTAAKICVDQKAKPFTLLKLMCTGVIDVGIRFEDGRVFEKFESDHFNLQFGNGGEISSGYGDLHNLG